MDVIMPRTCGGCPTPVAGRAKWCSDACRVRIFRSANAQSVSAQQRARRKPVGCLACGTTFLTHRAQHCTKLCQAYAKSGAWPTCKVRVPKPEPLPKLPPWEPAPATCAWCSAPYVTNSPHHGYCTDDCKARAKRMRRRGKLALLSPMQLGQAGPAATRVGKRSCSTWTRSEDHCVGTGRPTRTAPDLPRRRRTSRCVARGGA